MKKKKLIILILVFSIVLAVSCSKSESKSTTDDAATSDPNPQTRDSLTIVEPNEWIGMDTLQIAYYTSMQTLVADPLLMINDEGEIVPCLASSYEISADGKQITLTIPEDLKYATGETLLPEDIKASIQHGLELSPANADYAAIQTIEVDGNKVIIHMDKYSSSVLFYLTWQYITVIDKDQIDSLSEDELLWSAVPYGLYKLDEFVPGSHASISPNPYYKTQYPGVENKGVANVDNVTVKFMSDDFSIVQGLKSGEIDIAFQVSFDNLNEFENNDDFVVKYNDPAFSTYMILNNDNPILSDDRVCEAIMLLINREQIAEVNPMYRESYSHVLDNMMGFNQDFYDYFKETYSNNSSRAKELLAEAGYVDTNTDGYLEKDGKILEFSTVFYYPKAKPLADLIQIQLKEAGIKMNIEQVEFTIWNDSVTNEKFDAAIGLYGSDYGGGATITYRLRDANTLDQNQTSLFYESVEKFEEIIDPVEASVELAKAQKILVDSKRCFPLVQMRMASVYRKDISNLKFLGTQGGIILINDVN